MASPSVDIGLAVPDTKVAAERGNQKGTREIAFLSLPGYRFNRATSPAGNTQEILAIMGATNIRVEIFCKHCNVTPHQ